MTEFDRMLLVVILNRMGNTFFISEKELDGIPQKRLVVDYDEANKRFIIKFRPPQESDPVSIPWRALKEGATLRSRVFALYKEGSSLASIARATGVSHTTIHCWLDPSYAKKRREQSIANKKNMRSKKLREILCSIADLRIR